MIDQLVVWHIVFDQSRLDPRLCKKYRLPVVSQIHEPTSNESFLFLFQTSELSNSILSYRTFDSEETGEQTVKNEYIQPGAGIDMEFETDGKLT